MKRSRAQTTVGKGELMPDDAVCAKCTYSLRGLRSGGRCPECGTLFVGGRRRKYHDDTMTDAPVHYLRRLAVGCWLLAMGGLAASVCLWAGLPYSVPTLAGAALCAALWWVGVFIVTMPRQTHARPREELRNEWRRTRPLALAGQAGWVAAAACFAAAGVLHGVAINTAATNGTALVITPTENSLRTLAWAGYFLSIAGLVPLCLILADLADWAGNTGLGDRYRDSAWAICVGVPIFLCSIALLRTVTGSTNGALVFAYHLARIISGLAVVAGSLIFLASLIRLAGMSLWAISNAVTGAERDERLAERQRLHEEQLAARTYAAPPPLPGPGSPAAPVRTGPYSPSQGHYMPRTANTSPYELAPEEDSPPH